MFVGVFVGAFVATLLILFICVVSGRVPPIPPTEEREKITVNVDCRPRRKYRL